MSEGVGHPPQLFVQPFPPTGAKYQITKSNGYAPAWAPGGKEIFFTSGTNQTAVVAVSLQPFPTAENPIPVPRAGRLESAPSGPRNIDVTADGRIVGVLTEADGGAADMQMRVVLNWFEELKQRVPR